MRSEIVKFPSKSTSPNRVETTTSQVSGLAKPSIEETLTVALPKPTPDNFTLPSSTFAETTVESEDVTVRLAFTSNETDGVNTTS